MIEWIPRWDNGGYWAAYKDGSFIGAVYSNKKHCYRHYYSDGNANLVFDDRTKYNSLQDAAKEFYK